MSKLISDKYVKLNPREHVLARPGMYIGSIEEDIYNTWVFKESNMVKENIKYVPGLFKIFDEILVNAIDHSIRLKIEKEKGAENITLLKNIHIRIDKEKGIIEVENDGNGVEIVKHPEYNIYIPELIFGNMMTSSNYDDKQERIIGGVNGLGSKATNIFSTRFEVETVDSVRKLHYHQVFEDNMEKVNAPIITKYTKKPFTIIRFTPDYQKLNLKNGLTDDMYHVILKRVYDACAVTDNDISIHLNDEKLEYKNFENYVDLFLGDKRSHDRVYEKINDRWEIIASYNNFSGFEQMSFVNGIWTIRGGKHVDYIANQIIKKLTELIVKKNKNVTIKPQSIKENLFLFVKCVIVNPAFDSQSKETLTTPQTKFGSKGEVSDKFIEKLYKSGIVDKVLEISQIQSNKTLQKTDGKKKNTIRGLPQLEDANWAGTNKSSECVLILTEGLSAASMAIAGLAEVGRNKYGVFPLRGKILNVRDAAITKISDNEEITNIKKIIGLESGKKYENVNDLRYGRIMLMTDSDEDGKHIRGLLFNVFHTLWPSLLHYNNFMSSLTTPIVKAVKGKDILKFYNLPDYNNWILESNTGYNIKYYKGLGTSTAAEAIEYFKEMKMITYKYTETHSDEKLALAFDKKKADERKKWIGSFDRNNVLNYNDKDVTYEDFIDKELIHFSNYDVERNIPNVMDGLKTSQRKILFCCFKKHLTDKEIKVAQLAAYVSENSAYHHGEASLQSTIVGMAQDFVGANNLNILMPNGQFGTRSNGGSDAAQPRYIFTVLNPLTSKIFNKEDTHIITYLKDDGSDIEPEFYVPIIPMILVNGSVGIGTGFSTNIPCFNPIDIITQLKILLKDEDISENELLPWYRDFNGKIEKNNGKYISKGKYIRHGLTKIEVSELPIGTWTYDFKCLLEDMLEKNPNFKNYENNSDNVHIKFMLTFTNSEVVDSYFEIENNGFSKFENDFKMVTSKPLGITNMYAFDSNLHICKYDSPIAIIQYFYKIRLQYYQKRKDYITAKLLYDLELLKNKIRFIKAVIAEEIIIHKMKKQQLEELLEVQEYMKHEKSYDYITKIPVYNLTIDKVEDLEDDIHKSEDKYNLIFNKDIKDIWLEELEELENSLSSMKQVKKKMIFKK